jgi:hypothetical protein
MPYPGMLRRVAVVRADVSEERIASIIRATRMGELGTTLAETNNRSMLFSEGQMFSIGCSNICQTD